MDSIPAANIIYLQQGPHGLPCFCSMFVQRFRMADFTQIEWTNSTWNPVTGLFQDYGWLRLLVRRAFFRAFSGASRDTRLKSGFDLTIRPGTAEPSRYNGGNLAASLSIR